MRFSTTSVILLRKTKRRSDFLVSFFVIFLFVAVTAIAVMGWGTPALAAPPGSPYAPGETLNPSCAPGAANCTVTSGITGQSTSTFVSFYLTSSTLGGDLSFSFNSSTKVLTIGTSTITGLTFTNASGTNLTTSGFLQGGSLSVSGVSTLQGITFTNATGTNLMVTNLIATSFTLSNLIATGTISADIINATSGLTFANATSAGNLQVGTFSATTVSSTNVSSTNITASGYGLFPTLGFTNSSGTNFSVSGYGLFPTLYDAQSNKYVTSSVVTGYLFASNNLSDLTNTSTARTNIGLGSVSNALQLIAANNLSDLTSTSSARTNIGFSGGLKISISSTGTIGFATSSISQFTNDTGYLTTSTWVINASGTNIQAINSGGSSTIGFSVNPTFTNVSSTNFTASGFLQGASGFITNVSSTNITASGFFQGATLNISGQSSLASVSSTNILATGYLNISGQTTLASVSSTNITASGYGLFPTLYDAQGNRYVTSSVVTGYLLAANNLSDLASTSSARTNIGFSGGLKISISSTGTIGLATSSISQFTNDTGFITTSTWVINASGTNIQVINSGGSSTIGFSVNPTFTNVSSTNLTASGFLQGASGFITNVSSTNITASGFFQGATLNISGQSSLASVSSTNILATGYLTVQGVSTLATTTISSSLSIGTSIAATNALLTIATSTNIFTVLSSGFVGIATSSPTGRLHVVGIATSTGTGTVTSSVTFGDLSINGTSTTLFGTEVLVGDLLFAGDQYRIVTAIGSATSAIVNAPFFPALTNATSFSIQKPILKLTDNMLNDVFTVHGNGMVTADQTQFGSIIFPEDAGMVGWADMSVSSTLLSIPVGYSAQLGGNPVLTVYGESNGAGGVKNQRVGIGTSVPLSLLSVVSSTPASATGSLAFFGDGVAGTIIGGSAFGTILGSNMSSTFNGDFINFQVNSSTKFSVNSSGSLAIATSSLYGATSTLTVCARSNCTAPTTASSTNTVAFFASTGGLTTDISIVARGVITSGLADVGEYVEVVGDPGSYQAGEMLSARMIGSTSSVQNPVFERSPIPYDGRLVGVVTKTAGLVAGGGEEGHGQVILALAGRVPVIVSFKNGPIEAGDPLTSSDMPGVAMKATKPGRVAGVALTSLTETSGATGTVMMFANPHWFAGSEIAATSTSSGSNGNLSASIGDSNLFDRILSAVKDWFASVKEWAVDKLTATTIISGRVETDVLKTNGIEMLDRATGELYCVVLENGEFVKTPGACPSTSSGQAGSGQASSSDPVVPPPLPPTDSTSTPPVVPPTDSTSTPPVVTPPSSEPTSTETVVIPVEPPVVSEPPAAPPSDSPPVDPATASDVPPPADSAPVN